MKNSGFPNQYQNEELASEPATETAKCDAAHEQTHSECAQPESKPEDDKKVAASDPNSTMLNWILKCLFR